jgi:hypothetical protein
MSSSTRVVPAETSLLCEGCGYLLDGLPTGGNCPECGMPMNLSLYGRHPPLWETAGKSVVSHFRALIRTTCAVIFRPKRFFRSLNTRSDANRAQQFAIVHWALAGLLFGWTAQLHVDGVLAPPDWKLGTFGALTLGMLAFGILWFTTRLAAVLTAWEARYRGYRLPRPVVLRGLFYHAAHYLPVALMAFATVAIYVLLTRGRLVTLKESMIYTCVLCGEVVVAAGYLFNTYWIAMRQMMYANQ